MTQLVLFFIVAFMGGLGAVARYIGDSIGKAIIDACYRKHHGINNFQVRAPHALRIFSIVVVNALGCFLAGLAFGWINNNEKGFEHGFVLFQKVFYALVPSAPDSLVFDLWHEGAFLILLTGFLGGFTTFSTVMVDIVQLLARKCSPSVVSLTANDWVLAGAYLFLPAFWGITLALAGLFLSG